MLLVGNDKEIIQDLKTQLFSKFDMKDLGTANYILGMEIKRDRAKFSIPRTSSFQTFKRSENLSEL